MREFLCIDSPLWRLTMPKAYSCGLRERVIEPVEAGASRREAAERFEVSVSSAVKRVQRWRARRSAAPKPRGGSTSPLEEFATEVLALIAERPDRTLLETVAELRKRRIRTSRSSLWRDTTSRLKKPASRLVFIDETAVSTNLVRLKGRAPQGAMTGEMFLAYVEQCLVPTLRRNDIVVMDNCRVH